MAKRIKSFLWLCLGLLIIGNGCSLLVYSNLGSDPCNIMAQGVARVFGAKVGTANIMIQFWLLVIALIRRSKLIGIGTIMGTVIIGNVMNIWSFVAALLLSDANLFVRIVCVCAAPVIVALGVSIVKTSQMGMVPNDIAPMLVHEVLPQFQFRNIRITYDLMLLLIGVILGGTIGLGTITSALFTGPAIQFFLSFDKRKKINMLSLEK